MSVVKLFKQKMNRHLVKLTTILESESYIMDLMYTYSKTRNNKFSMVQNHIYKSNDKSKIPRYIEMDIDKLSDTPFAQSIKMDGYKGMLYSMSTRYIKITKSNKCFKKLLTRSKIPIGLNKINFPAYVVMFYYVSFIYELTHDYEGILVIIKHFANCVCKMYLEDPMEVLGNILKALDYNISCSSSKAHTTIKPTAQSDNTTKILRRKHNSAMQRMNAKFKQPNANA